MIDAIAEPLLAVDEIQGNILGGFNKDHQALIFASFGGIESAKSWLRSNLEKITYLREVSAYRRARKAHIRRYGDEPEGMTALWQTVAFTFQGLGKLTADADLFSDMSFRLGAARGSVTVGDPTSGSFSAVQWPVGSPATTPDVFWLIAGDDPVEVSRSAAAFLEVAKQAGLRIEGTEYGHDLSYFDRDDLRKGHEHFGFKDGISQPAVRGRVSDTELLELVRQPPDPDYTKPEFAQPGQPLVYPGQFVLGYPLQALDFPRVPAPPDTLGRNPSATAPNIIGPWWAQNGSFLVYRRLRQDVAAFNKFLNDQAAAFGAADPLSAPSFIGSRLVGRWKSGAPVMRSPSSDNPVLGKDDDANNAFEFAADGNPNDGFGAIPLDADGKICPMSAHIRKVNSRDIDSDLGSANRTLTKRILRRGIPYGAPLPDGAVTDDGEDRGLLFLCYQRSISSQFEFLCGDWMNSRFNPRSGATSGGFDLLVGQNPNAPARDRSCFVPAQNSSVNIPTQGVLLNQFVNPTGGGYFFTPSRTALRDVLSK